MNIDKYNKAAYRAVVWKEAARLLRERYFPEGAPAPELICNDVFRAPREVPSEIIQEVLLILHKAGRSEEDAMLRFRLEEMSDDQIKSLTDEEATAAESDLKHRIAAAQRGARSARKGSRKS
jgi:hypothetical protein